MCEMCDSEIWNQTMEGIDGDVELHGYALMMAEATPDHPLWLYTIGLTENAGHPELSILGVPYSFGYVVLDELSRRALEGEQLGPGKDVVALGAVLHVHEVGARMWAGDMFRAWKSYYGDWRNDGPAPPASAVELVPCAARPDPFPHGPGRDLNRTERRALMWHRQRA